MADDPIAFDEPITLDLTQRPGGGPRKTFESLQEVEQWVRGEYDYFTNLTSVPGKSSAVALFQSVSQRINNYRGAYRKNPTGKHATEPLYGDLKNMFVKHEWPVRGSPAGAFVEDVAERVGKGVAGQALHTLVSKEVNPNVQGLIEYYGYTMNLKSSADAERKALHSLHSEWTNKFEDELKAVQGQKGAAEAARESAEKAKKRADDALQEARDNARVQKEAHDKEIAGLQKAFKETTERLEAEYRDKMSVREAVEYWSARRDGHWWGAVWSAFGALVLAGVFMTFIDYIYHLPIGSGRQGIVHSVMFATQGALILWGIRVLVKLFLSNKHLETLSDERVVMIRSYLSFLVEDDRLTEDQRLKTDERMLILNTLFAPTSSGLVKDDTIPPGTLDVLTKLMGGKAKPV